MSLIAESLHRIIESFLTEDIESVKKYYPNIPKDEFERWVSADPTYKPGSPNLGKYGKWILTLANRDSRLDGAKVWDILFEFDKVRNDLKNTDLMKYKSVEELEATLQDEGSYKVLSDRQALRRKQKVVRNTDLSQDAEKVYEDEDWEVWIPYTWEASCKLGRGTEWCTATTESDNYFKSYTEDGPLYINIDKKTGEKYQFHFDSESFMDASDNPIDLPVFLLMNPGMANFYANNGSLEHTQKLGLQNALIDIEDLKKLINENTKDNFLYVTDNIIDLATDIANWGSYEAVFKLVKIPVNLYVGGAVDFRITGTFFREVPVEYAYIDIQQIAENMFRDNSYLREVRLGAKVKQIDTFAFRDCYNLKDIVIEEGVLAIGKGAFQNTGVVSIELPDSMEYMDRGIFKGCQDLRGVKFPKNIKQIPALMFDDCYRLQEISIPEGVFSIGPWAFGTTDLIRVWLPHSLKKIGNSAFYDTKIKDIYYNGTIKEFAAIEKPTFTAEIKDYTVIHCTDRNWSID